MKARVIGPDFRGSFQLAFTPTDGQILKNTKKTIVLKQFTNLVINGKVRI
jgi:hypothetical protein